MTRTALLGALFLGLVLLALTGARTRRRRRRSGRRLERAMRRSLEGLGFLLNDETDRAVDVFLRLAEREPEAHEVQFALAHLFRRRGELERSIRIHQSFIARPDLPRPIHVRALYELACDYLSAGLHDRAESLLKEIADDPAYGPRALRHLLTIYEYQSEWDAAYVTALRLPARPADGLETALAHYRCEAAERAQRYGSGHEAVRLYREAIERDPRCLRAHAALGRIALARGDDREALAHFERALWSDLRFALHTYPDCYVTFRRLEDRRGLVRLLERLERESPAARRHVALAALVDSRVDHDHARRWTRVFLEAHPALAETLVLLGVLPPETGETEMPEDLPARLRPLLVRSLRCRCVHCGYTVHHESWQCPSCRKWSSLVPHLQWIDEDADTANPVGPLLRHVAEAAGAGDPPLVTFEPRAHA